jgi:hypothetical protein
VVTRESLGHESCTSASVLFTDRSQVRALRGSAQSLPGAWLIDQALDGQVVSSMPHLNQPVSVAFHSSSHQGLYDPAFERDSCGVGFVADLTGQSSALRARDRSFVQIEPVPFAVPGT